MILGKDGKKRCFGGQAGKEFYAHYHDTEWGIENHDEHHLFEMLILEGAQAGLSWETVLKKRAGYKKAFHNFNPVTVASMNDSELEALRENPEIIRNKLKIYGTRKNAQIFLAIQKEYGSFYKYLSNFIAQKPVSKNIVNFPVNTPESDALSKDLQKRGMIFVGSTIIYSFMQAVGLVNDHLVGCWRHGK